MNVGSWFTHNRFVCDVRWCKKITKILKTKLKKKLLIHKKKKAKIIYYILYIKKNPKIKNKLN